MAEFIFADEYVLESGQTRDFYENFLQGLVHKTNNIVGVIQGFGSLLLTDDSISADLRENTEQMDSAARIASDLYKKVLTAGGAAKVDCDRADFESMHPFLQDKAAGICEELNVSCSFEAKTDLPKIFIDTAKLSEIFEELIRNAAESAAETEKKSVTIELFLPGEATSTGHVDLFIKNDCREIPGHEIADYYEAFHSTKGNQHFGIGLTIAAVLCGQMNTRLGLRYDDEIMTTWMAIPLADES